MTLKKSLGAMWLEILRPPRGGRIHSGTPLQNAWGRPSLGRNLTARIRRKTSDEDQDQPPRKTPMLRVLRAETPTSITSILGLVAIFAGGERTWCYERVPQSIGLARRRIVRR